MSAGRCRISPLERLQALVDDAARFNKMAGVTGVLLHDGGRFLQYIEGPPDGIGSVYERILQAGSHIDIIELARGRLGQRQFPYWSMRALPVEEALLRQLSSSDWSGLPVRCRVIVRRRRRWTCSTTLCSQHCTPAERQREPPPQ
jgi:hypothetical protein